MRPRSGLRWSASLVWPFDRKSRRGDAVSYLTVFVILQVFLPERMALVGLGGVGAPALLLSLLLLGVWIFVQVQRPQESQLGHQRIRTAYLVFVGAVAISFVAAMLRPINGEESSSATLGMVVVLGWTGVLLLANDYIPSGLRMLILVRRLVMAGATVSTLAAIQFMTGKAWIDRISIPGLQAGEWLGSVATRSGFARPSGTALHPLELASVISMLLPLALALARHDTSRSFVRRWYPVVILAFGTVLTISRSGIIAAIVGIVVLAVVWDRATRLIAAVSAVIFVLAVGVLIPTMLGSLFGLFTTVSDDGSAQSRSGSYEIAREFIDRAPVFGRGYSTFLPSYRILDNQYLLLAIELGLFGLIAFLVLLWVALTSLGRSRRRAVPGLATELAQAMTASIAAGATGLVFFDGLSFPMCPAIFFLLLGMVGAFHRIQESERISAEAGAARTPAQPAAADG